MRRVITFGTFDLFHIGHLNIIERAKAQGDYLIVGVSSDALNFSKKQKYPVCPQESRSRIVAALKVVDEVFFEESLELKAEYIKGRFDEFKSICEVVYLDRTPSISTTELIEIIKK
jgi:cytidyltransferase-like protein